MRKSVEEFLIKSQRKVVAHYQQILRDSSIPGSEREAIEQRLMRAEADLKSLGQRRMFVQAHLAA